MIIPDDRTNLNARLTVMQVGLGVMFFVLVVSFWAIQVLQHDKFLEEAENNHTREIPLRAPRGAMFDRHGKVLVENREALNISLVREQAQNLDRSMRLLAAVTGVEERYVRDVVDRGRALPRYQPIRVVADASEPQIASVAARRHELERRPGRARPDPRVSARLRRAPVRLRRRDLLQAAGAAGLRAGQGGIADRPGRRRGHLQRSADGKGRRPRRHRQQRWP